MKATVLGVVAACVSLLAAPALAGADGGSSCSGLICIEVGPIIIGDNNNQQGGSGNTADNGGTKAGSGGVNTGGPADGGSGNTSGTCPGGKVGCTKGGGGGSEGKGKEP